jgi:hypothetical protein
MTSIAFWLVHSARGIIAAQSSATTETIGSVSHPTQPCRLRLPSIVGEAERAPRQGRSRTIPAVSRGTPSIPNAGPRIRRPRRAWFLGVAAGNRWKPTTLDDHIPSKSAARR